MTKPASSLNGFGHWLVPGLGRLSAEMTILAVAALSVIGGLGRPAAADAIEKALVAEGVKVSSVSSKKRQIRRNANVATKVKREDDKVYIEGAPPLAWGKESETTFAGALAAALSLTHHPYTATEIMGFSGLAFRVRWGLREKGWCPSIPVGEFPEERNAVMAATGWQFHDISMMQDPKNAHMERYADEMAAAIDAGLPVIGYPHRKELDCGYAYGYEGAGKTRKFLWRSYWSGNKPQVVPAAEVGPWIMIPRARTQPPSERTQLVESLKIAVRNWRRSDPRGVKGYVYLWGREALEAWQADLRDADNFSEKKRKGLFFLNWWSFDVLTDARRRAPEYLTGRAPHLNAKARKAVERAAEIYKKESNLLWATFMAKSAFLGPWTGKKIKDWTPAVRNREQKVLAKAAALEAQAIAELEKALAAKGVEVAAAPIRPFTDEEKKRLLQWRNIFGPKLESCVQGAAKNPEIGELLALEISLEPFSETARAIRKSMAHLEPAELLYWSRVEAIVSAIGSNTKPKLSTEASTKRRKAIRQRIQAMQQWLAGARIATARKGKDADAALVEEVYGLLGRRSANKKQLVALAVEKMTTGNVDAKRAEALRKPKKQAELVYRIEHLDALLWSYDLNFRLLLQGIAAGKAIGKYNEPGGPFCWVTGNPEDKPRVESAIKALDAWLKGKKPSRKYAAALKAGARTDEQVWLTRCLLVHLKNHRENYYGLTQGKGKGESAYPPVELKHVEQLLAEVTPREGRNRWRWRSQSYIYMQTVCARAAGFDVDYDTFMTVSGCSGAFAYHHKDYHVVYHVPGPARKRFAEATGFSAEWKQHKTIEAYWRVLKQTIESGQPVHAPFMEQVLFIGYQEAARKQDRKVRPIAVVFVEPNAWWTWAQFEDWYKKHSAGGCLGRFVKRVKPLPAKQSAIDTLRTLVEYSVTDARAKIKRFAENGTTFGLAGLEAYAADIADLSKSGEKELYFQGGWRGCHDIYPQLGGRWSTENYLKRLATSGALSPEATRHVAAAAREYHAVCAAWEEYETHLADRNKNANKAWSMKKHRLAGAAAIRKAIKHERAGLAEIEKALTVLK